MQTQAQRQAEPVFMFQHLKPNAEQDAFMTEGNARFLQAQVEGALCAALGEAVRVPLDERFVQQMQQVVNNSLRPAPGVLGLAAMNRTFINQYIELQYYSIRHQKLFKKYFIDQDRMRTMPYGQYVGDDAVVVSPSQYMMSHPWKARQASYLAATTRLVPSQAPQALQAQASQNRAGAMFYQPRAYCEGPKTLVYGTK